MKTFFTSCFLGVFTFYPANCQDSFYIIKQKGLESLLHKKGDSLYVVNFWVTWCAPCVAELPYLLEYAQKNPKTALYLISLDFVKDTIKVRKFIDSRQIRQPVYLLAEPNYDAWINKVNPNWSGSIPATLFYTRQFRFFHAGEFTNSAQIADELQKHQGK